MYINGLLDDRELKASLTCTETKQSAKLLCSNSRSFFWRDTKQTPSLLKSSITMICILCPGNSARFEKKKKVLFSLNPDGFEASREGDCHTSGRDNSKRIDLNRNFPDQWRDPNWKVGDTQLGIGRNIAKENLAMIEWILNSRFVLSLNLHAGSEVASYGQVFAK